MDLTSSVRVSRSTTNENTSRSHVIIPISTFLLGRYVFIEASSPRRLGEKARLVGVKFTPSQTPKCLQFWYHMSGASIGELNVYAKSGPGNKTETLVWKLKGSQGNKWNFGGVSVSKGNAYRVGDD